MVIIEEIGDYSKDDMIIYKQKNENRTVSWSFVITIEKYPDKKILQATCASNCYPISDEYKIQTSWDHGKEKKIV